MDEKNKGQEEGLSLIGLIRIIKNNLLVIIVITAVILVSGTVTMNLLKTEQYQSTGTVLVGIEVGADDGQYDFTASRQVVETVASLMKMDIVIDEVVKDVNLDMKASEVKKLLSVDASSANLFVSVSCKSENKDVNKLIVDSVIANAIEISNTPEFEILNGVVVQTQVATDGVDVSLGIVFYALIFGLAGIFVSALFVIIKEFVTNPFYTKSDIKKVSNCPIIGEIFDIKQLHRRGKNNLIKYNETNYRKLAKAIEFSSEPAPKVILGTSSVPNEGKTTTIVNIAKAAAKSGKKVLVMDFDFRKPLLSQTCCKDASVSVTDYFLGRAQISEVVKKLADEGFDIVPAIEGSDVDVSDLVGKPEIEKLFAYAKANYDVVFVDTTPVYVYNDATSIAKYCDAVFYSVALGKTNRDVFMEAFADFKKATVPLIGINITWAPFSRRKTGYYY